MFFTVFSYGQTTITLNQLETGTKEHCAISMVHFQPGYSYTPTGVESMYAHTSFYCESNHKYANLTKKLDGGYYVFPANMVYFKYHEKYRAGDLDYKIYEFKNQVLISSSNLTVSKIYGDNWIALDMCAFNYIQDHYYVLEVIDEKGRKEYLRFVSELGVSCNPPGGGGGQ